MDTQLLVRTMGELARRETGQARDAVAEIASILEEIKRLLPEDAPRDLLEGLRGLARDRTMYQAMMELHAEAVCRWLPDTTLTFVDDGYCKCLGRTPQELIGQPWISMVPAPDREGVWQACRQMSAQGQPVCQEHRVVSGAGQVRWMQWTHCPVAGADGQVAQVHSAGRDITEQVLTRLRLEQSARLHELHRWVLAMGRRSWEPRRFLQRVCGQIVDRGGYRMAYVGLVDDQTGLLRPLAFAGVVDGYLNAPQILGSLAVGSPALKALADGAVFVCNDIQGAPAADSWAQGCLERDYRSCASFPLPMDLAPGCLTVFAHEKDAFDPQHVTVLESLTHDLAVLMEEWQAQEVRRHAGQAVRDSEARYRELAESITDVFLVLDAGLRVTYWNRQAQEFTGIARPEAMGRSLYEIFDGTAGSVLEEACREVLATGRGAAFVTEGPLGRGYAHFLVSVRPCSGGVSLFAKDVSALKSAEAALVDVASCYRLLSESIDDGVMVHDAAGRVVTANRAAERTLGLSRSQMQGRNWEQLPYRIVDGDGRPLPMEKHPLLIALTTGKEVPETTIGIAPRQGGACQWVAARAVPYGDGDYQIHEVLLILKHVPMHLPTIPA